MSNRVFRAICTVALGYTLAILPMLVAEDRDGKPAKLLPTKAPDWSAYARVGDVVGEVVKADDKSITLRVTWFMPQVKNGGGNNARRPQLGNNNRNFRNPYARGGNRPRGGGPRVTFKEQHHDYTLEFVPESLVRLRSLPPKYDESGKRASYTQKELDLIRAPEGVPGYTASHFDLRPGSVVEVVIIRDKSIPASKATEEDLRVKYAIILGKDPNPPRDISDPKEDRKGKGKKDKN